MIRRGLGTTRHAVAGAVSKPVRLVAALAMVMVALAAVAGPAPTASATVRAAKATATAAHWKLGYGTPRGFVLKPHARRTFQPRVGAIQAQTQNPLCPQPSSPGGPGCQPPLIFKSGSPVMGGIENKPGHITIVPVYWAPSGYTYDTTYKAVINQYLKDVAAASHAVGNDYSVMQQYYQQLTASSAIQHIQYQVTAGSELDDTDPFPASNATSNCTPDAPLRACISDSALQKELASFLVKKGQPYDDAHLYLVMFPSAAETCLQNGSSATAACSTNYYCAYHSSFSYSTAGFIYANMPWPDPSACGDPYDGPQQPNGDMLADTEIDGISHETIEAVTDTFGAWIDNGGSEIADECVGVYGAASGTDGSYYNQVINGHRYYTQDEFSNEAYAQGTGDPPSSSDPTAYPGWTSNAITGCVHGEQLPSVGFTQPTYVVAGQAATFDGSQSADQNSPGSALTYSWSWGDGTAASSGATPTHTFTNAGTYSVKLTVTTVDGWSNSKTVALHVLGDPIVTSTSLPPAVTNDPYAQTLTASNGSGSYSWVLANSSTLPGNMTLSSAGVISGTATNTGTTTFSVQVTDNNTGLTGTGNVSLTVNPPVTVATTSLSNAAVDSGYSQSLAPSGGSGPFTWALAGGTTLPAGLTLSAAGSITGTPTATGTTDFTVQVTDSTATTATQALSILVEPSDYVPLTPHRLFDTRTGAGGVPKAPIKAGQTITVQVAGVDGIPADAVAVTLNITATDTPYNTYITAWPHGIARPIASNLDPKGGTTQANFATIALPTDGNGKLDFFNYAGTTDLLADIAGYYLPPASGGYSPLSPIRLFDTRTGLGGVPKAKIGQGQSLSVRVAGVDGIPSDASAVALNITATNVTTNTYITAWPDGTTRPSPGSSLDPPAGRTTANFDVVRLVDGRIDLFNFAGSTDLLADIAGYYRPTPAQTAGYTPISPVRLFDTRLGTDGVPKAPVGAGQMISIKVAGIDGVPANATAVAINTTATDVSKNTYVITWPGQVTRPTTSSLDPQAGVTTANFDIVSIGADGTIDMYNFAGTPDLLADIAGYIAPS